MNCDVSSASSNAVAFDAGEAHLGPIDSVVVNAGINHAGTFSQFSVVEIDAILSVNLRGAMLIVREVGSRMAVASKAGEAGSRCIVFIASILVLRVTSVAICYAAPKAVMIMLAKVLALEWGRHGIRSMRYAPVYAVDIVDEWFRSEAGMQEIADWLRRLMPVSE